jgi:hypothetical protein
MARNARLGENPMFIEKYISIEYILGSYPQSRNSFSKCRILLLWQGQGETP